MKAKIKEKKEIAKNTLSVVFDLLGKNIKFFPGQFFYITLIKPPFEDEKGNERHFSIVNTPNEKGILRMATRLTGSAFKKSLLEMPEGTEVKIGMISGNFTLPKDTARPIVFITGGIGITPFKSMLSYVDQEKLAYQITLLYSNRNREEAVFLGEFKEMEKNNPNIKIILTMTEDESWEGEKRLIDGNFIKEYFNTPDSNYYMVAGPAKMVEAMNKALLSVGVRENNIQIENFPGY